MLYSTFFYSQTIVRKFITSLRYSCRLFVKITYQNSRKFGGKDDTCKNFLFYSTCPRISAQDVLGLYIATTLLLACIDKNIGIVCLIIHIRRPMTKGWADTSISIRSISISAVTVMPICKRLPKPEYQPALPRIGSIGPSLPMTFRFIKKLGRCHHAQQEMSANIDIIINAPYAILSASQLSSA